MVAGVVSPEGITWFSQAADLEGDLKEPSLIMESSLYPPSVNLFSLDSVQYSVIPMCCHLGNFCYTKSKNIL